MKSTTEYITEFGDYTWVSVVTVTANVRVSLPYPKPGQVDHLSKRYLQQFWDGYTKPNSATEMNVLVEVAERLCELGYLQRAVILGVRWYVYNQSQYWTTQYNWTTQYKSNWFATMYQQHIGHQ